MELNRKLSQQSWQEVKHLVLDDCLGCCLICMVLSFYNFHERGEFTSIFTSILLPKLQLNYTFQHLHGSILLDGIHELQVEAYEGF